MDMIKTTATAVEKLRRQARELSRATGKSLTECREAVALQAGYQNWKHVTACLAACAAAASAAPAARRGQPVRVEFLDEADADPHTVRASATIDGSDAYFKLLEESELAPVVHHPLRGDFFIDLTIEGRRFRAEVVGPNPILEEHGGLHWVQLGACSINRAKQDYPRPSSEFEWFVCKYDNQPRVSLAGLSDAGIRRLALEFGLVIEKPMSAFSYRVHLPAEKFVFERSRAWLALKEWGRKHPRKLARRELGDYLGDWRGRIAGELKKE
ncbi:hypothetical protein [Methylibium petroleiphilum]|uniref:Uncharacterized protein n=1 Tax=Methylibium petroleiphilum (strain ATCC BAA-1232 / LMG 22953 / PM1) TaxID=420662 RepID=A2SMZ8_METPP|nr:hypothetical protein [Methylibium petroleiphilum]ABM96937.1 hypothetical protein Mpe_B0159 [Methylibium petroleiphilum PM1]